MNITKPTPAQSALYAVSRKCFGGRNYNNEFWYKVDEEIGTGTVYKILEKGKSKEIGPFLIESNGYISTFPSVSSEVLAELNAGKDSPGEKSNPATDTTTEAPEKPKKRRGRPPKSQKS